MDKYVKYISRTEIEYAPKNKDNIFNFDINIEKLIEYGYKKFVPVVEPETNRAWHIEYIENKDDVEEIIIYDETQEEADEREFRLAMTAKLAENDRLANQNLVNEITIPVTEDEIECVFLYDAEGKTERNLNSAAVMMMAGIIETKQWTDERGVTVELRQEDIAKVGMTFNTFADKIWALWGDYKAQIEACTTIEEIEAIELDYNIVNVLLLNN